jgi:hypothetical protein
LQSKYEKKIEELQARFEKENKDLQSNREKQELQAMYKDNEELQAKSMGLHKNVSPFVEFRCRGKIETSKNILLLLIKISDILENQILAKREQLRQLEGFYSILNFPLTRLEDASSDEGI